MIQLEETWKNLEKPSEFNAVDFDMDSSAHVKIIVDKAIARADCFQTKPKPNIMNLFEYSEPETLLGVLDALN